MDLKQLFLSKNLSEASVKIYSDKLKILNDGKNIKSLNYLNKVSDILNKIQKYKPNSRRTFIIAITSAFKCLLDINPNNKKIKKKYEEYSKILKQYNNDLRDQTIITQNENENWITMDDIKEIYKELTLKKDKSLDDNRNHLILSLYHLIPPRRNRDYQFMKIAKKGIKGLPSDFNYFDMKERKFIFNNYKTSRTYQQQVENIDDDLYDIIINYIKKHKLKNDDFLINNFMRKDEPLKDANSITRILNNIFNKKIGVSMLRKIYLTDKYKEQKDKIENDSKAMGTSINTINNNYIKRI